jgi:hypothetical protein
VFRVRSNAGRSTPSYRERAYWPRMSIMQDSGHFRKLTTLRAICLSGSLITASVAGLALTQGIAFADTYTARACSNSPLSANIHLCLYSDNQNSSVLLGQFGNSTSVNITNTGSFNFPGLAQVVGCGQAVTPAGGTSSCYLSGYGGQQVQVCDKYYYTDGSGRTETFCTGYYN